MEHKKERFCFWEWLRRRGRGTSVFWQNFVLLGIVLVLALCIQLFSNSGYGKLVEENYLTQAESNFRRHCGDFSDRLYEPYTVPAMIETTEDYTNLMRVEAGQLPTSSKTVVLSGMQKTLKEMLRLAGASDMTEYFLYFTNMDAAVTQNRLFPNRWECFGSYLRYEDMDAEDVHAWLTEPGFVRLSGSMTVQVGGKECRCVTLLIRPSGSSAVLGILYDEQTVLEMFGVSALPEGTYFRLTDASGLNRVSYGHENKGGCHEFTASIRGVGGNAVVGIPKDYFSEMTAPTRLFGLVLLGLTLLLGLVMCVVLSGMGAKPLQKLLSSYGLQEGGSSRNEISRLADILASSQVESEAVNQILSKSVLVRVLSGGVLTEKEEQRLLETYPVLEGSCRIAIVHTTAAVEEFGQTAITELVAEHLPESFACATVSNLETGVLLPDEEDALSALAKILTGINDQLKMDGLSVLCGVSAAFVGVHSAYAAVRQARFSIPIRESSYIEVYSTEESGDERPGVFSWLTHERLYQAVMKNDRADTVAFIRALAADKYYSAADAKEVFYNVRFVVRSTAKEMMLPLPEADTLEYREEMRPKENFRVLEELACTLFDRLHARKETDAKGALENVVAYVTENFRNPDLSATMAATHFALPVKTVYAAIREKTGKNMGDFIIDLRMKEAAKLLCTTQKSVDEIAAWCGYPAQSTFYRVFKKYFGESPSKYRSLH